ncbi:MAG TPA: polysaccharide biosynthesis protein, partial [Nonomuraea sp.]|nr:polysaccharide biosynthesis protein [Nonomuraea sp.]
YKILPVSFAYLNDRAAAAGLQDLAPEDLLLRRQVRLDTADIGERVAGQVVMVTGAAGSIGSEITRQVAAVGPSRLVLLDTNENGLYFLYRDLRHQLPSVAIEPEVGDVRDAARVRALFAQHRPALVFHAAAHKHVPLMETAPEEAVKNNVGGCRNLIRVAADFGVQRFVLISTDKAVNPTSVMGVTKRVAELVVAEYASKGHAGFTAVRFGNVLGSAGSVVPLFKSQIAAGGPVTVTHPDCRRYLMTIPEAVGLVLAAGLRDYGDLCILEMGEPIRILDLARLMITLTGRVPDKDIPIVFTGLRPGEKLDEELMTEEEAARSVRIGDAIRAVSNPAPPAGFGVSVDALEAAAAAGDRVEVIRLLQELVPSFRPLTRTEVTVAAWIG